jgi:hypothetical protein
MHVGAHMLTPMSDAMKPFDTSAEAHALQTAIYRRMTGAERAAIAFRLTASARSATLAGIMARHPDYSPADARRAFARLTLGDDLVSRIWPVNH